jgi:hypothetical protein
MTDLGLPENNSIPPTEKKVGKKYVKFKDLDVRLYLVLAIIGELLALLAPTEKSSYHTPTQVPALLISFLFFLTGTIGLIIPAYRKNKTAKEIKMGWILVVAYLVIIAFMLLYLWLK